MRKKFPDKTVVQYINIFPAVVTWLSPLTYFFCEHKKLLFPHTYTESKSHCCQIHFTGDKDEEGSLNNDLTSGLSKKQRKARTAFTDHQLQTLEKTFERQKYLSVQDRMELANKLNLSDTQVKTWYQNRR